MTKAQAMYCSFILCCTIKVLENKYCRKGALSDLKQFLATESSLKIMKNTFHFTLKALFVLKIFKFKLRLISNFMTSQTGKQIIGKYILPNISRSKGNHTMKSGHLTEHNMKNVFLEK